MDYAGKGKERLVFVSDPDLRAEILAALNRIDFAPLAVEPRLDLIRLVPLCGAGRLPCCRRQAAQPAL